MLQDRISKISDYFKGIRVEGGLFIVNVEYRNGWKAFNSSDDSINVAQSDTNINEWFYYANMSEVTIDSIFDLIDETIIFNENIRRKIELLKVKVEELKVLFDEEPIEKLETLQFVFNTSKKKKKKNTNGDSENHKKIIEEINDTNTIE